jgi:Uma2 family endonuclease
MAEAQRRRWTFDEYMAWEAEQPTKHEFVDGAARAMTGGTAAHDVICNNLRARLADLLRGRPCRARGPDVKVATGNGNIRYPDAVVDCGQTRRTDLVVAEPTVVLEVLSRSTAWLDQTLKLRDYAATPAIRHYVLISQDDQRAVVYSRDAVGNFDRNAAVIEGEGARIDLPSPGIALLLADLYEGLDD